MASSTRMKSKPTRSPSATPRLHLRFGSMRASARRSTTSRPLRTQRPAMRSRPQPRQQSGRVINDPLLMEVALRYMDTLSRHDIERSDFKNLDVALPKLGMLVHEQYTMTGHFHLLARLRSRRILLRTKTIANEPLSSGILLILIPSLWPRS